MSGLVQSIVVRTHIISQGAFDSHGARVLSNFTVNCVIFLALLLLGDGVTAAGSIVRKTEHDVNADDAGARPHRRKAGKKTKSDTSNIPCNSNCLIGIPRGIGGCDDAACEALFQISCSTVAWGQPCAIEACAVCPGASDCTPCPQG